MKSSFLNTTSMSASIDDTNIDDSMPLDDGKLFLPNYSEDNPLNEEELSSSLSMHSEKELSVGSERLVMLQEPTYIKKSKLKRMIILQKWEGIVQEILNESFIAILSDKERQIEEEAEILIEEIDEKDRELLEPGAVFYWSIGYNDEISRQRFSMVKFRRLPTWDKDELEFISRDSNRIAGLVGWK